MIFRIWNTPFRLKHNDPRILKTWPVFQTHWPNLSKPNQQNGGLFLLHFSSQWNKTTVPTVTEHFGKHDSPCFVCVQINNARWVTNIATIQTQPTDAFFSWSVVEMINENGWRILSAAKPKVRSSATTMVDQNFGQWQIYFLPNCSQRLFRPYRINFKVLRHSWHHWFIVNLKFHTTISIPLPTVSSVGHQQFWQKTYAFRLSRLFAAKLTHCVNDANFLPFIKCVRWNLPRKLEPRSFFSSSTAESWSSLPQHLWPLTRIFCFWPNEPQIEQREI